MRQGVTEKNLGKMSICSHFNEKTRFLLVILIWRYYKLAFCWMNVCNFVWNFIWSLLTNTIQIWVWIRNLYNKHKKLPYSELGRIHKDTFNRPLKLGHFFSFGEFSLFYWLKLSKPISFSKWNGLGWFFCKIVA